MGLVDWTKETFQFQKIPNEQFISRIIRNESKICNELDNTKLKMQRGSSVKFPEFEKYEYNCYEKCLKKVFVWVMN